MLKRLLTPWIRTRAKAKSANATKSALPDAAALLERAQLSPVLADVGSAGITHQVWQPIAAQSTLLGFEPDTRNKDMAFGQGYARALLIEKAVSFDNTAETVYFVLTDYPSCSSMLEPDLDALASFSFRDYFRPVRRGTAPATSLNRVIAEQALPGIHWLKLDSQGADLRILQSLDGGHRDHLLAVDIEPGLIKAYKNEDLFTDCHPWLLEQGFWMSRLSFQSYPKVRPETLSALSERTGLADRPLMARLHKAPTAIEGRYLREIGWLASTTRSADQLVLAFVFGLLDEQLGYAYDVACLGSEMFRDDERMSEMRSLALEGIAES